MSRCRFRYEDLPDRLRAQVDGVLRMQKPEVRSQETEAGVQCSVVRQQGAEARDQRRGPNKTEAAYRRDVLGRRTDVAALHYEGITLRMANGHRYTPDWVVVTTAGRIECHEVKGGDALQSQQRARLAFDQVRVEFPWLGWVWAVKTREGWKVEGGWLRVDR